MHSIIKDYIEYLKYIGILSEENIFNFTNILDTMITNYNSQLNINKLYEIITNSLGNYLSSLTENIYLKISSNLMLRYLQNKNKILLNSLKNILINKEKRILKIYLNKWKFNYNIIDQNLYRTFNNNISRENKINNFDSTKIFKSYNNFVRNNKKNNNIKSRSTSNIYKKSDNLLTRQKKFLERTQNNYKNSLIENENLNNLLCPFVPTLYNKKFKIQNKKLKNKQRKSPFQRLYDDMKDKIKYKDIYLSIKKNKKPINNQIKKNNLEQSIENTINILFKNHNKINHNNKFYLTKNNNINKLF